jgi:hypothetical protein
MAGSVVKSGIDVFLILLPYPLLFGITMRNSDRWILLMFLSLSILEVAAGGVRIYATRQLFWGESPGPVGFVSGSLEQNLGVVL